MAGLESPMQTKAFNIFWHKADLRLVEKPEPEAPVFAFSRPTLFGGREEFLLQYPARLETPSELDVSRHRFTVRHGKKRRSFRAPDVATFDTWLSALEQALEPKRDSEHRQTPSSAATTATTSTARSNGDSSQGRASNAGSAGTRASSRGRISTLASNPNSRRSCNSQPRAPALRLTLERPCFTRDPNNLKLIKLHRPAATIAEAEVDDADDDEVLDVPDTESEIEDEPEDETTDVSEKGAASTIGSKPFTSGDDCTDDVEIAIVTDDQSDVVGSKEAELEVKLAIEALVAAVINNTIQAPGVKAPAAPTPRSFTMEPAPKSSSRSKTFASKFKWVPLDPNNSCLIWVRRSIETDVNSAPPSNTGRKRATSARRWVPVDPTSTRPIWIRRAEHAAVRMESRYKAISDTRKWVPLDPENSRFIWVRHQVASGKPHRH
ncbi:hypothetical protein GN244_ATG06237 [Phytophthora infestans]|uniref:PH domain-containing protein n=1 Tax=Phytophthora infestans TaxID=4787 RepID=A0A833TDF7_PHYIN|nr:hypothetical protein GN244_ATG06237 [Phytophthora infestans]KAF4143784.1 hypothetical protein GN958_ATG07036 [Phytophthora infestans]KAI9986202.1 hypothetical protein PInf_025121 [Phytophthora infestans]